jgi:Ran GTPase-activating protein (RanGAP) involved in mRNA processing and transport
MEVIVGVLLLCEYLESAAFQRNSLDDEAMPHIARLISDHASLSSLDLSLNGIADTGAKHIALALSCLKYSFAKINLRCQSTFALLE